MIIEQQWKKNGHLSFDDIFHSQIFHGRESIHIYILNIYTYVYVHILIHIYIYVSRMCHGQKTDCIPMLVDGNQSTNRDSHCIRIPIMGWMTINHIPCFDQGTYQFRYLYR